MSHVAMSIYLKVAEIRGLCVEEADASELDGGIQAHVLEAAKAGYERRSTLTRTMGCQQVRVSKKVVGFTNRITVGTHEMSKTRDVKGAATEASASDNEIPTSAALSAPQSLAPSPQNPQQ